MVPVIVLITSPLLVVLVAVYVPEASVPRGTVNPVPRLAGFTYVSVKPEIVITFVTAQAVALALVSVTEGNRGQILPDTPPML